MSDHLSAPEPQPTPEASTEAAHETESIRRAQAALALPSPPRAQTWRERHALKLLGGVMVAMFTLVIIAQVAC